MCRLQLQVKEPNVNKTNFTALPRRPEKGTVNYIQCQYMVNMCTCVVPNIIQFYEEAFFIIFQV